MMTRWRFLGLCVFPTVVMGGARTEEKRVFDAVNSERVRRRGKPLVWNEELAEAARQHSESMARHGFFSHVDPRRGDLRERLEWVGILYSACAENIYTQTGGRDAVSAACAAWMKSAGHRANILNAQYAVTGVGVAVGRGGACFFTQIFLRMETPTDAALEFAVADGEFGGFAETGSAHADPAGDPFDHLVRGDAGIAENALAFGCIIE